MGKKVKQKFCMYGTSRSVSSRPVRGLLGSWSGCFCLFCGGFLFSLLIAEACVFSTLHWGHAFRRISELLLRRPVASDVDVFLPHHGIGASCRQL